MKIKEVDARAKAQPIDDIADRAADDQADRDREKIRANPAEPENQDGDDQRGSQRKNRGTDAGAVEQAKADPGIAGQDEIEKRGDRLLLPAAPHLVKMPKQREFAE